MKHTPGPWRIDYDAQLSPQRAAHFLRRFIEGVLICLLFWAALVLLYIKALEAK